MRNKYVIIFITIVSLLLVFISLSGIIKWTIDNYYTKRQINMLRDMVKITDEKEGDFKINVIPINTEISKSNPYWDYIKLPLWKINFQELKNKNKDTVGFINVPDTNVNYPIVQAKNNEFYLNHTFNKSVNSAGWVFMDYRNDPVNLNINTVIYAHGRYDKTMFGTLKDIFKSEWLDNESNHYVRLVTPDYSSIWQVFSVYKIKTELYYLTIDFETSEDTMDFYNNLLTRSTHSFATTINENDKILTLSTCYNDKEKVVMHAKLIKIGEDTQKRENTNEER